MLLPTSKRRLDSSPQGARSWARRPAWSRAWSRARPGALAGALLFVFVDSSPRSAQAEEAPQSEAEADYDRGIAAFQSGDIKAACPLFEKSYRADPLPGVLFTLATCEARQGRLASSIERFEEFLQMVDQLPEDKREKQESRIEAARGELNEISAEVPHLVIELDGEADASSVVRLNGEAISAGQLGTSQPLDPGDYVILLETDQGVVEERRISVAKGEDVRVQLGKAKPREIQVAPVPPPPAKRIDPWFYVASGIAGAGLLSGSITGVMALTASADCESGVCENDDEVKRAKNAQTIAHVSTASFIVGAAGGAAAAVLYLRRDSTGPGGAEETSSPWALRIGASHVTVGRSF